MVRVGSGNRNKHVWWQVRQEPAHQSSLKSAVPGTARVVIMQNSQHVHSSRCSEHVVASVYSCRGDRGGLAPRGTPPRVHLPSRCHPHGLMWLWRAMLASKKGWAAFRSVPDRSKKWPLRSESEGLPTPSSRGDSPSELRWVAPGSPSWSNPMWLWSAGQRSLCSGSHFLSNKAMKRHLPLLWPFEEGKLQEATSMARSSHESRFLEQLHVPTWQVRGRKQASCHSALPLFAWSQLQVEVLLEEPLLEGCCCLASAQQRTLWKEKRFSLCSSFFSHCDVLPFILPKGQVSDWLHNSVLLFFLPLIMVAWYKIHIEFKNLQKSSTTNLSS